MKEYKTEHVIRRSSLEHLLLSKHEGVLAGYVRHKLAAATFPELLPVVFNISFSVTSVLLSKLFPTLLLIPRPQYHVMVHSVVLIEISPLGSYSIIFSLQAGNLISWRTCLCGGGIQPTASPIVTAMLKELYVILM
jgi:hypothetical protein